MVRFYRGEDAASNQVSFDLSEPQLSLIEPRRVSRLEVEVKPAVLLEELVDQ